MNVLHGKKNGNAAFMVLELGINEDEVQGVRYK